MSKDIKSAQISGSYYIRARKTGWFVYHQKCFAGGIRHRAPVPALALRELGFRAEWTVAEAKRHCSQLNKERSLLREKIRLSAKRVTGLKTVDETLFPQDRIDEFQALLEEENFGSEKHLEKLKSHFQFIQAMCNKLRIQPVEYKESAKKIYKYFVGMKISPSYCTRILSLLNRWGRFVSRKSGLYFEDVPAPRGRELSAIADAQQTKRGTETDLGVRAPSLPLSPETLQKAALKLIEAQHNWLLLSVWFGLRPGEVDLLADGRRYRVEFNLKKQVKVLHIYQSKLQSISEDKRWKAIPIIFPEQEACLKIIEDGNFKKPLHKTMRKHVGRGITLYGGRKGFVDLMLSRGQKIEDISMWLGHKDISTTWMGYKDRQEITFTRTGETQIKSS